jgi:hypothetical protein
VIKSITKSEHWPALAKWTAAAKAEEQKGLRLIQAIMKYQGAKRFRTKVEDRGEDKAVDPNNIE